MTSASRRRHQARDIKVRAKQAPPPNPTHCAVMGCRRLSQRSSGKGLSETYCRNHQEHYRRHGSHWRRSYLVRELAPFRAAAKTWLRQNRETAEVRAAVQSLDSLLSSSGRPESAFRLRGKSPRERARIALARLYAAGKGGLQLLEIVMTIKATVAAIGPRGNPEYQHVQIAKLAHRLASGTILRDHEGRPYRDLYGGRPSLFERYPRAEGVFMRVLGERIRKRADIATDPVAVSEVVAMAMSADDP